MTRKPAHVFSFLYPSDKQETTRVRSVDGHEMSQVCVHLGKVDDLKSFKGNIIMGHLIPAGTGLPTYKKLKVTLPLGDEIPMAAAPRAAAPEASATAS